MPGNRLGPRGVFAYTSDTGEVYALRLDVSLAEAAGLALATSSAKSKPTGFRPRFVWAESNGTPKARRKIVCNTGSTIFEADGSSSVTIDGEPFTTTGRIGERFSFPKLAAGP